jgi:hypothetical protein
LADANIHAEVIPLNPVCGCGDIKIFNEEGNEVQKSTRICGGKTPTTSRNVT